jgi:hypothetical protein
MCNKTDYQPKPRLQPHSYTWQYDENQNRCSGDLTEHTGIFFRCAAYSMCEYPQSCFRQRIENIFQQFILQLSARLPVIRVVHVRFVVHKLPGLPHGPSVLSQQLPFHPWSTLMYHLGLVQAHEATTPGKSLSLQSSVCQEEVSKTT